MKLVTFGCSFTEGIVRDAKEAALNNGIEVVRKTWGQRIADNLGIDFENKGRFASGNMQIGNKVYNYDFEPDDIAIIAWSGPVRNYIWHDDEKVYGTLWVDKRDCDCGTHINENLYLTEVMLRFVNDYLTAKNIRFLMTSAFVDYKQCFQLEKIKDWDRLNWIEPHTVNNTLYDIVSDTWLNTAIKIDQNIHKRYSTRNEYIAECYHPSNLGHILIGDTLTPYVKELVDR